MVHDNTESLSRPFQIGPLTAANRLMRSATYEAAADPAGAPLWPDMSRLYGDLARGGAGLIVTGHAYVHPNGKASPRQCGLSDRSHVAAWQPIVKMVHDQTAAPLVVQLAYAARQALLPADTQPAANDPAAAFPPLGTPIMNYTERQLLNVVEAFAEAAERAAEAGFDGVQLHLAHGYFFSECLSHHTNQRQDQWGGADPENRRRLTLLAVDQVRQRLGSQLALMVKMNGHDYLPPRGLEPAEAAETAGRLESHGVQLVEVSAGMYESGRSAAQRVRGPETEAYLLPFAAEVARRINVPVATVGGYRTGPVMLRALGDGLDMISLSRPLIREPDLPLKLQRDPNYAASCVSCNRCFSVAAGAVRCLRDHPQPIEA